jgi:hypothetical protein
MDHACRQLTGKKLHVGQHQSQICDELGVSRSLVFKIKKLQDCLPGPHTRARGRSKQTVRTFAAVQTAMAENPQGSISSWQDIIRWTQRL